MRENKVAVSLPVHAGGFFCSAELSGKLEAALKLIADSRVGIWKS
jgi:hypothetical protein